MKLICVPSNKISFSSRILTQNAEHKQQEIRKKLINKKFKINHNTPKRGARVP
jgi:hypothetical protein